MSDNVPQDLKYTEEHEWARVSGKIVTVGITHHAQSTLGDIVYVELPKLGAEVKAGGSFGAVESVKAVSDLFAPISGKVVKVNDALVGEPELINTEPYGDGWIVEIELSDAGQLSNLLDAAAYEKLIKE
ncbi:glycine cleavage system protein H [Corallococcus coralloides]|uniref:Glycine cleavage system H protein n=1 Tax=Corallococcus coralloides TaxID=184914 RepID=A0A410RWU4_CORCK|nr:glycine cleavage system protein GcvH [Corallococcus coralloides]QAT86306.1 glycine cleavage system protein H [Corallococcus coralloides]